MSKKKILLSLFAVLFSYKVGQLKILKLRQRAREALGERFDLRASTT